MSVAQTMKIMVVDSRDVARDELCDLLRANKGAELYELCIARDGEEAMRIFLVEQPDLILIHLEEGSDGGKDLCGQIRASEGRSHTGIIFLSEGSMDIDALSVACLEMGADDFLRPGSSSQELMARIKAVLRLKAMTDELRSANHRLRVLSQTDDLTGLANMRAYNQKYSEVVKRCRDGEVSFGVIMLDIDHFKNVNDSSDHLMGSFVLSEIGYLIRSEEIFSDHDVPARFGGDEFVMLCLDESPQDVMGKADRLRRAIEKHVFVRDNHSKQVTASLGVAWVGKGFHGPAEDVIKAADLMLYRSKESGRNRLSGMHLKYPVDLDKIGRAHLVSGDLRDNDSIQLLISPKVG